MLKAGDIITTTYSKYDNESYALTAYKFGTETLLESEGKTVLWDADHANVFSRDSLVFICVYTHVTDKTWLIALHRNELILIHESYVV